MRRVSWARRPGGNHLSQGQTTADVLQLQDTRGRRFHREKPSALATDFHRGISPPLSSPHWLHGHIYEAQSTPLC